ncbi:MAG TPA: hypothetical protein VF343_01205, partial [Syntrophales bacterium]
MTEQDHFPSSADNTHESSRMLSVNEITSEKKSILVVDDDVGTRSLVVDAICQSCAYAVTEASDGVEGLEKLG